jgi:hypothetical protein
MREVQLLMCPQQLLKFQLLIPQTIQVQKLITRCFLEQLSYNLNVNRYLFRKN